MDSTNNMLDTADLTAAMSEKPNRVRLPDEMVVTIARLAINSALDKHSPKTAQGHLIDLAAVSGVFFTTVLKELDNRQCKLENELVDIIRRHDMSQKQHSLLVYKKEHPEKANRDFDPNKVPNCCEDIDETLLVHREINQRVKWVRPMTAWLCHLRRVAQSSGMKLEIHFKSKHRFLSTRASTLNQLLSKLQSVYAIQKSMKQGSKSAKEESKPKEEGSKLLEEYSRAKEDGAKNTKEESKKSIKEGSSLMEEESK